MAFRFNPFTGNLDVIQTNVAEKVADTFDCAASAAVGNLVVASTTVAGFVDVVTANVYDGLILGMIIRKPTTERAEVLILGKVSGAAFGLSGLTLGNVLFVDTDGTVTTTPPLTGHREIIGRAIGTDTIVLIPSSAKVIQS